MTEAERAEAEKQGLRRPGQVADMTSVPVYPLFLAAAYLTAELVQSWAPLQAVPRPFVVMIGSVFGFQAVLTAVARSWHQAAYLTALVFLLLADHATAFLLFSAAAIPLAASSALARRITELDWRRLTTILNLIATVALGMTLSTAATSGAFAPAVELATDQRGVALPSAPDIYLILLDGYPRSDTLLEDFGFNNDRFLGAMEDLGFTAAAQSHSNYTLTPLTLASLLNMRHIHDLIPNPPFDVNSQARELSRLIGDGAALQILRRHGYTIETIASHVSYLTVYGADDVYDSGNLTELEWSLLQGDGLRQLLPDAQRSWFFAQHRQRILANFNRLAQIGAETSDRPRFILAHVMAPHLPVAFKADGTPTDGPGCFWEWCPFEGQPLSRESIAAINGQVSYVNGQILRIVSSLIEGDRPAVVVVFSDHGLRHLLDDKDEMFRSLLLSHTPGHEGLIPRDASPINLLGRIFNAYLGETLPLASEEMYWTAVNGGEGGFLAFEPWPHREPARIAVGPSLVSPTQGGRRVARAACPEGSVAMTGTGQVLATGVKAAELEQQLLPGYPVDADGFALPADPNARPAGWAIVGPSISIGNYLFRAIAICANEGPRRAGDAADLVRMRDEASGGGCGPTTKARRFDVGLDADGDQLLDDEEVVQATWLCQGRFDDAGREEVRVSGTFEGNRHQQGTATCAADHRVIAGGGSLSGAPSPTLSERVNLSWSGPTSDQSWTAAWHSRDLTARYRWTVYAICARAGEVNEQDDAGPMDTETIREAGDAR